MTKQPKTKKAGSSRKAPKKRKRDPRLPAPGTVLTREYKGKTIRVTVQEEGFRSGGKDYRSLSGIASEITGTSVNGFLWFKLVDRNATAPKASTPAKPRKATAPRGESQESAPGEATTAS